MFSPRSGHPAESSVQVFMPQPGGRAEKKNPPFIQTWAVGDESDISLSKNGDLMIYWVITKQIKNDLRKPNMI